MTKTSDALCRNCYRICRAVKNGRLISTSALKPIITACGTLLMVTFFRATTTRLGHQASQTTKTTTSIAEVYSDPDNIQVCGLGVKTVWEPWINRIAETGCCYMIASYKAQHYSKARDWCRAENSELLVLDGDHERCVVQDLLRNLPISETFTYTDKFYVGIEADSNRVWYTVDGDLLSDHNYEAWALGEPNNKYDNEYCGAVFKDDARYDDVPCFNQDLNYICKIPVDNQIIKYT